MIIRTNKIRRTVPAREAEIKPFNYQSGLWKAIRSTQLKSIPYCEECKRNGIMTKATVCDHIKPVKDAPHLATDPTNLQSLCKRCHDSKSSKERRR
jgi:5-methylcytosine-specific restriction protein A